MARPPLGGEQQPRGGGGGGAWEAKLRARRSCGCSVEQELRWMPRTKKAGEEGEEERSDWPAGNSPLFLAVKAEAWEAVRVLMEEFGADPNLKNHKGRTAAKAILRARESSPGTPLLFSPPRFPGHGLGPLTTVVSSLRVLLALACRPEGGAEEFLAPGRTPRLRPDGSALQSHTCSSSHKPERGESSRR
eukprot:321407-Hanusia_phi.AAC.1